MKIREPNEDIGQELLKRLDKMIAELQRLNDVLDKHRQKVSVDSNFENADCVDPDFFDRLGDQ